MSKKIQKRRTFFELEPDGFSIHTFELSRQLTHREYKKLKENLYDLAERSGQKNRVYKDSYGIHRCWLYSEHGIRIRLEKFDIGGYDRYYLRMVVNPRQLIDPDATYLGIFSPKEKSLKRLQDSFRELFRETKIPDDINDYALWRLDLCVNIRCGQKKIFRELVRVLRKLPTPKKYTREFYKHADKKKANQYNKHYIRFACGTHELVIYDKVYQISEEGIVVGYTNLSESVLRVELRCEREYLLNIQKKKEIGNTLDMIAWMMRHSDQQIIGKFAHCFRTGMFCQIGEIERRVNASSFHKEKRRNMLELSHRMQRKQNLDKELKAMEEDGVDTGGLLDAFREIDANPVPLWQNFSAPCLPGPVELLQGISGGKIPVEYIRSK